MNGLKVSSEYGGDKNLPVIERARKSTEILKNPVARAAVPLVESRLAQCLTREMVHKSISVLQTVIIPTDLLTTSAPSCQTFQQ